MNVVEGHNKADGLGEVFDLTRFPSLFPLFVKLALAPQGSGQHSYHCYNETTSSQNPVRHCQGEALATIQTQSIACDPKKHYLCED